MRVLVTRAAEDAGRTARALAAMGHEPVLAPVIETVPTGASWPEGPFDGLVATSAQAAPAEAPPGSMRLPVFAVGGRTQDAFRSAGFADVRSAGGDAAALARLVAQSLPAGTTRLLYLAGHVRKPDLEELLAGAGFAVAVAEVYDTRPAPPWDESVRTALAGGSLDAVLHFSRRSAAMAAHHAEAAGLAAPFARLAQLCLSADVARGLPAGLQVRVAASPDEASLLALLPPREGAFVP